MPLGNYLEISPNNTPGQSILTGTYANRPSAGTIGRVYLPTDGFAIYRDTGTAWVPFGPVMALTDPTTQTFAWINQGSATVSTTNGGIFLSGPAGAGNSLRIRKKTAAATPYSITAGFLPLFGAPGVGEASSAGLCFRESSTGKLVTFVIYASGDNSQIRVTAQKFTNATTISAAYNDILTFSCLLTNLVWLRIRDDGTNLIFYWSSDGINFMQVFSVARTDFLLGGADEVGFLVNSNNATYAAGMTLLSWA